MKQREIDYIDKMVFSATHYIRRMFHQKQLKLNLPVSYMEPIVIGERSVPEES